MLTILDGQISFAGGLHDALEAVTTHKNVQRGVLRITSETGSGLIGVFCGRFITGAVVTQTGQTRIAALKRLLAAKTGSFAFMDAMGEHVAGLNQSLAIDLRQLLDQHDFSNADLPLSEESIAGMAAGEEEIHFVDTSYRDESDDELEEADEQERIAIIDKTYQRLIALSEQTKPGQPKPFVIEKQDFAPAASISEVSSSGSRGGAHESAPAEVATVAKSVFSEELQELSERLDKRRPISSKVDKAKFQKLERWSEHGEKYLAIAMWSFFVVMCIVLWIFYNKEIVNGFKILQNYVK